MGKFSKTVALLLTLIIALSSLILMVKPVIAQTTPEPTATPNIAYLDVGLSSSHIFAGKSFYWWVIVRDAQHNPISNPIIVKSDVMYGNKSTTIELVPLDSSTYYIPSIPNSWALEGYYLGRITINYVEKQEFLLMMTLGIMQV